MPRLAVPVLICVLGGAGVAAAQMPRELAGETRNIARAAPDAMSAAARPDGAAPQLPAGKLEAAAPAQAQPASRNSGPLSRAGGLPPDTADARPATVGAAASAAPDPDLMRSSRASSDNPARIASISAPLTEAKRGTTEPPSHIRAGRQAAKGRR